MKKTLIKLAGLVGALLITGMLTMPVEQAKAQEATNNSGSGTQLFCKRDYSNFITNGIDFDGEGFVDYWSDILVTYNVNYCKYNDIDSLINRIDKARKQLRQAFYVCDNNSVGKITAEYYQLSAELYYLRHAIKANYSPNPKASEEYKNNSVTLDPEAKANFMKMFVTKLNYFNQSQANEIYEKIRGKYESKLEAYRNCVDPNWEQLEIKIDNLGKTFDTVKQLLARYEERKRQRNLLRDKRIAANPGLIKAFSATSASDFFNRVIDFRINSEPLKESTVWEQITNTAKENAPIYYAQGGPPADITLDNVAKDITKIEQRDRETNFDLVYLAEYDLKYRQVQGFGLDNLKANLDDLKEIIHSTFPTMDDLRVCTANIVGKQCSNKFGSIK